MTRSKSQLTVEEKGNKTPSTSVDSEVKSRLVSRGKNKQRGTAQIKKISGDTYISVTLELADGTVFKQKFNRPDKNQDAKRLDFELLYSLTGHSVVELEKMVGESVPVGLTDAENGEWTVLPQSVEKVKDSRHAYSETLKRRVGLAVCVSAVSSAMTVLGLIPKIAGFSRLITIILIIIALTFGIWYSATEPVRNTAIWVSEYE